MQIVNLPAMEDFPDLSFDEILKNKINYRYFNNKRGTVVKKLHMKDLPLGDGNKLPKHITNFTKTYSHRKGFSGKKKLSAKQLAIIRKAYDDFPGELFQYWILIELEDSPEETVWVPQGFVRLERKQSKRPHRAVPRRSVAPGLTRYWREVWHQDGNFFWNEDTDEVVRARPQECEGRTLEVLNDPGNVDVDANAAAAPATKASALPENFSKNLGFDGVTMDKNQQRLWVDEKA